MKKIILLCLSLLFSMAFTQTVKTLDDLPVSLVWETNNESPVFASSDAKQGGIFRDMITDFPPTFRVVGPNANSSFRGYLGGNRLSLISIHPETQQYLPELATHWAIQPNNKTVFFKLNPKARWSDGQSVTAADYLFTMDFMRSKHIVAPWYNNYFTKEIVEVTKYDDYTISVTAGVAKPREDVLLNVSLSPTPKHFHKLDENWVQWANWKIEPVTGAYQISNFRKGRYIDFKKVKNWWGKDEKYFKNRFNVDKVRLKVVRNTNVGWNMFLKGDLDSFPLILPEYWHERSLNRKFEKGYIRKYWFYNDIPRPSLGLFINMAVPLFADERVRYAIAHSLNIDKMNKTIMRGDYDRLPNFHTGYGEYTNTNIKPRVFDTNKANELLDAAGWVEKSDDGVRIKDGQRLSFTLSYSSAGHSSRLSLLREEMLKSGIEMQLQLLTGASSYRNMMEKKHQVVWSGWSTGVRPAYYQHFHSKSANKLQTNNITNTSDKEMDRLIDSYKSAEIKADRIKFAYEIQQKIYDIGAFIPSYMVPYTREAAWAYVRLPESIPKTTNSLFNPMELSMMWIDKSIKKQIESGESLPETTVIDTKYRVK